MRWSLYLALFFVCGMAYCSSSAKEREERKRAFLQAPIFTNNKPLSEQMIQARKSLPDIAAAAATSQPSSPQKAREPKSTTEKKGLQSDGEVQHRQWKSDGIGICGTSAYLQSYCFRKMDEQHWLICSGKWGGCTTRQ